MAVDKARALFGEKILIEGGISMINELLEHKKIDRLELSVTQVSGGEDRIDIQEMLSHFSHVESVTESETTFYTATRL